MYTYMYMYGYTDSHIPLHPKTFVLVLLILMEPEGDESANAQPVSESLQFYSLLTYCHHPKCTDKTLGCLKWPHKQYSTIKIIALHIKGNGLFIGGGFRGLHSTLTTAELSNALSDVGGNKESTKHVVGTGGLCGISSNYRCKNHVTDSISTRRYTTVHIPHVLIGLLHEQSKYY